MITLFAPLAELLIDYQKLTEFKPNFIIEI